MTDLLTPTSMLESPFAEPSALSVAGLRRHADQPAIVSDGGAISHGELADLVQERAQRLGTTPRLVVLHGSNTVEFVVTYLAALEGRHPVIVAADGRSAETLGHRFGASMAIDASSGHIDELQGTTDRRVTWHRDLAVLMSTSGSTGSPKLVRLSRRAVDTNAVAIAESLSIRPDDRAITSLPLHYCYGLSVVTSHLAMGASVVLTDTAVVDPCFVDLMADHGVTTLSGVPHTFDMIDRLTDDVLSTPTLRRVTQAGGRMDPAVVERLARRGLADGWDLVVMYGQTEATARMATLRGPEVIDAPTTVGRAIPGGGLRIDRLRHGADHDSADGVGEVVYSGPNVMMGYAEGPHDLDRGHEVAELRTGDLGRVDPAGRLEIVGRLHRFVKLHGKRIDLDHLADDLGPGGDLDLDPDLDLGVRRSDIQVVGDDDGIVVAIGGVGRSHTTPDGDLDGHLDGGVAAEIARRTGLPTGRVLALRVDDLPRTASGKVDGPMLIERARQLDAGAEPGHGDTVAEVFRLVLGVEPHPDESFASLGGDSFSYVEMSIRLESVLGVLPSGWHLRPLSELEAMRAERPAATRWARWTRTLDTSVVIRAVAILLIVCTHMRVFRLAGGAHALLAVAGFNLARFQLSTQDLPGRARRTVASLSRIAVPTSVWIGLNMVIAGGYSWGAVLLVNNYTGSNQRTDGRWEYWYFEAFVQIMIVVAILFSLPQARRAERARPFAFAVGALTLCWLFRFEIVNLGGAYNEIFRPHTVACFVALGWCAQRASTVWQRLVVTVLALVTTIGYFETVGRVDQIDRELRILIAVLALVWIRSVRLPRPVALVVAKIAAASMWIFLVHWQVWPVFTAFLDRRAAYVATIAVGVGVWWMADRVGSAFTAWRQRRVEGRSTSSQVNSADTVMSRSEATPVSA